MIRLIQPRLERSPLRARARRKADAAEHRTKRTTADAEASWGSRMVSAELGRSPPRARVREKGGAGPYSARRKRERTLGERSSKRYRRWGRSQRRPRCIAASHTQVARKSQRLVTVTPPAPLVLGNATMWRPVILRNNAWVGTVKTQRIQDTIQDGGYVTIIVSKKISGRVEKVHAST